MSWFQDHQPVLVKELRGRMRGARAFVVLTLFLAVLSAFMLLLYLVVASNVSNDPFNAGSDVGKALFLGIAAVALIQVMIIVPAQAAAAISGERERETFDLLVTTLLPAWKIIVGKLFAALAYAVLLIVAVVPLMALAFFFGGVTGSEVVIAILGLLVTALLYGAMGIFWSVISNRTMIATVLAQATNVMILLGLPFLAFVFGSLFLFNSPDPPAWFESYPFIYFAGFFAAMHPFVSLGAAEGYITSGETRLFFPIFPGRPNEVWIPAPWLAFIVEGLLLSFLLIWVSTIMLRPREPRSIRRASRSSGRRLPQTGEGNV